MVLKSGTLKKEPVSRSFGSIKERFFILEPARLAYYVNPADTTPKGIFGLSRWSDTTLERDCLTIISNGQRLVVRPTGSDTIAELRSWQKAIDSAIEALQGDDRPAPTADYKFPVAVAEKSDSDWFFTLFGFSEEPEELSASAQYAALNAAGSSSDGIRLNAQAAGGRHTHVQSKIEHRVSEFGSELHSTVNGATYSVGNFATPSLEELRARAPPPPGDERAVALKLEHIAVDDAFKLHTDPANSGAMFQAASQFNCLEMANPQSVPEDGVTAYANDHTQGPACSLAAAPATVFRNYFARMASGQIGQTRDNQLNNLHDMLSRIRIPDSLVKLLELKIPNEEVPDGNHLVRVQNGYTNIVTESGFGESSNRGLLNLKALIAKVGEEELRKHLRIGIHSRVEVPFASRNMYSKVYKTIPNRAVRPVVSQAFCSALACGFSQAEGDFGGYARGTAEEWEPLARLVLEASYEATLWAAATEQHMGVGSGMVFLTLVGGGVFKNRPEWIYDAIGRACSRLRAYPLEVKLCHYQSISMEAQVEVDACFRRRNEQAARQPEQTPATVGATPA